jgi:aminoglycoside phosphotransferase (APT) family kinase protein
VDRTEFLTQLHAQFAVPRSVVFELVERTTRRRVTALQRLIEGDENEVYRVTTHGGRVVFLRIAHPDAPLLRLYREAWAMEHARKAGIPVPSVLTVEPIAAGQRHAMLVVGASGDRLRDRLPHLTRHERMGVMRSLGGVLRVLHSVRMPGPGLPDHTGQWPDQEEDRRRYVRGVIADCACLGEAGLSDVEVERALLLLNDALMEPAEPGPFVLCHGDLSADHIFVDKSLCISGIIDWGMWSAGRPTDGLADVAMRNSVADFEAIMAGHSGKAARDPACRRAISLSLMMRAIGQLSWLVTSGQTGHLAGTVNALRRALNDLARERDEPK